VAQTTNLSAQVAGFAAGGIVVAFLGVRVSLLADGVTFAASALIIRTWIRARPVPAVPASAPGRPATGQRRGRGRHAKPGLAAGAAAGLRLVFGSPALRTPMLFGWMCAFYNLPEGVAAPLATEVGGGTVTVGLILAAQALGSAVGALAFSRLGGASQRAQSRKAQSRQAQWTGPLAVAACASLVPFAARPGLAAALLILAVSGLFGCYQIAANASFVQATPPERRSQAFGIAQGGMSLGEGIAILLAGAAAQHAVPGSVIAVAGAAGALCALALTITTARAERQEPAHRRRWRQAPPGGGGMSSPGARPPGWTGRRGSARPAP
jgi:MFS transporter